MKKIIVSSMLLLLVLLCITGFSSCGKKSGTTLYVYNWGEYISDGSEDTYNVNAEFEKYYYETYGEKVTVNYSTFSSNESLYDKISMGAVNYDVLFPSDYMIERMMSEGLLAELDFENIPNYKYISEDFKGEKIFYDPENMYSIPYTYGVVGIIYNTDIVQENDSDIGSWSLMWDEDYTGNILQFNNSRDAFGTALYYLGYDVNDADEGQWREALELLKNQKNFVQGYVMDEIFNKMQSNSAAISSYYAGDYLTMYGSNPRLAFYYPKEGTNIYIDAMCIPQASENKLIAERYINFLLSKDAAVANAEYTCYASPNKLVTEDPEYIEYMESLHPDAMQILYGTSDGIKTSFYQNLSPEKLAMINSLWEELKIESSLGNSIYIICIVIASALAVTGIAFFIRKKRRAKYYD